MIENTTHEDKMMDKETILGYAVAFLLPATIMYGTGYNGTADALILTIVWLFLIIGMFSTVLLIFAGIVVMTIGVGAEVPQEVKTKMEKARKGLRRWPISVVIAIWTLVALSSVGWTATAITYFILALIMQIASRLFVNTFTSIETELDAKTST